MMSVSYPPNKNLFRSYEPADILGSFVINMLERM